METKVQINDKYMPLQKQNENMYWQSEVITKTVFLEVNALVHYMLALFQYYIQAILALHCEQYMHQLTLE